MSTFISLEATGVLQPSCLNCHTQRLTVLTSTHLTPYTACLRRWMSMWIFFFSSQKLDNGKLFEPFVPTAFHFNWHWNGILDSCGFRVMYVGWEVSRDCVEPNLYSFHYSNKKYVRGGKNFSPSSYLALVWYQFLGRSSRSLVTTESANKALKLSSPVFNYKQ